MSRTRALVEPILPVASRTLTAAALVGLLGLGACESSSEPSDGQAGSSAQSAGAAGSGGEAGAAGEAGAGGSGPEITSSKEIPDMTLEKFKAMCDELGGAIEIHPSCGGANSCKGMSYDSDTHVFTEHTCKGLNTCTGYSCVLP